MNNLEREYRDCIKSRRDKIGITRHIMMHQVLYIVQLPNEEGDMHSTWCIMICLVIPILSLLLFIQSLYSLSKLQIFSSTCCIFMYLSVGATKEWCPIIDDLLYSFTVHLKN